VPGVFRAVDRASAQYLDRHSVFVLVHLRLECAVERPKEKVFGCRAQRFGFCEFLFRRCKQIALQAFLFGFEDLQSPAFLCRQLRVLNAQIAQCIWNAHDDAVGANIAEHAAHGSLI
jgi:hypothetical protein